MGKILKEWSVLFMDKDILIKNTNIKNLFLDPNNYRFIDHSDYLVVKDDKLTDAKVQARTKNFVSGRKNENIEDLLASFKKNGFLPVDQIQVKQIGDNQYLVLEGNRRITTLKVLQEMFENNEDIGNFDPGIFRRIPIVIYSNENEDNYYHQIVMGLKHINGNKKWPALNQARYLKSLLDNEMTEKDIIDALGISKVKLRSTQRTLALIEEYLASDYGDQFESDMYTIFEEVLKSNNLRTWLGWSDDNISLNNENRNRLFSWMSYEEEVIESDDDDEQQNIRKLDKIITKYTDIRELSKFINEEKAVSSMERSRSIAQAYSLSERVRESKFDNALLIMSEQVNEATLYSQFAKGNSKETIGHIINKLNGLAAAKGYTEIIQNKSLIRNVMFSFKTTQFSSLNIKRYKLLHSMEINNLKKINIFAGINNTGKSTLLEAIYLLTRQNDIYGFFDINRRRGKFSSSLQSSWLNEQFDENIEILGLFDSKKVSVRISKVQEEEDFDKSSYLCTFRVNSTINGDSYSSRARIFENKENETFFKTINIMCNSVYSSPFSIHNNDDILSFHEKSVESKNMDKILGFLRNHIDKKIKKIDYVGSGRFIIDHEDMKPGIDLTQFGEGTQRIFHIALQFASAENGVIVIDELENAIHHSLLQKFTQFIIELANTFNVQVFITSHSKECIDTFFSDENQAESISAYQLIEEQGRISCKYTEGKKLSRLISSIDADLRGRS